MQQGQVKIIGNYSYNLKHCLGEGAYGKVYQGLDTTSNLKVAIKKLDLRNFERDTYLKQSIIQEIEILKKFNHKNIVKFIDLISTQRSLYIITEFCKDGDMRELMTRGKKFNEVESWKVMRQIVQGFKELVSNAVIHRDLKPANILSHEGVYKIADFGFAKYVDNFSNQLLRSCVGSPLYMAPQILARKPYSTKCDIWSLGIIFYEMVFLDVPWKGRDERDLLKNILSVPLNYKKGSLSSKSEDFLKRSLTIEEGDRMPWEKVFEMFEVGSMTPEVRVPTLPNQRAAPAPEKERKRSIFQHNQYSQPSQSPMAHQPPQVVAAQIPSAKNLRNEIIFRNFVLSSDLFQKYNQLKNNCQPLLMEKLMICLSKSNLAMQANLINQANQAIIPALKKEQEYYNQFHLELVETLQRNGQLSHCERELELNNMKDGVLNDAELEKLNNNLGVLIKGFISELIEEHKRNPTRSVVLCLDNLADTLVIRKKTLRMVDIDFDQLNAEKSEEEDPRRMMDALFEKIRTY